MKKLFFLAFFAFLIPSLSQAACDPSQMEMDGQYDDWADCEVIVSENNGETLTNLQYWVEESSSWSTTDPGYDTWTMDDAAVLDIKTFKMTNDESYVYFYMENNWPMMNLLSPDGQWFDAWEILGYQTWGGPEELNAYDFVPSALPEFDHWMVWSFDKDMDGVYDYYFGAHLTLPEELIEGSDVALAVYQDDGDGIFDSSLDTKLADIDSSDGATSMDEGANPGSYEFEIKQNIETFYQETGISYGDTVKVRMETHSEIGDTTEGKRYTFNMSIPTNLVKVYAKDYLNKNDLKRSKVKITWDDANTSDRTRIKIYKKTKTGYKIYRSISGVKYENKVIMNLPRNTRYRLKLRSVDRGGEELILSDWSDYLKFNTN